MVDPPVDDRVFLAGGALPIENTSQIDTCWASQPAARLDDKPDTVEIVPACRIWQRLAKRGTERFYIKLGIVGVVGNSEAPAEIDRFELDAVFA